MSFTRMGVQPMSGKHTCGYAVYFLINAENTLTEELEYLQQDPKKRFTVSFSEDGVIISVSVTTELTEDQAESAVVAEPRVRNLAEEALINLFRDKDKENGKEGHRPDGLLKLCLDVNGFKFHKYEMTHDPFTAEKPASSDLKQE